MKPAINKMIKVIEDQVQCLVSRVFEASQPQEYNSLPEKSVSVNVLTEPPPGTPIRADIIFLHGIYG